LTDYTAAGGSSSTDPTNVSDLTMYSIYPSDQEAMQLPGAGDLVMASGWFTGSITVGQWDGGTLVSGAITADNISMIALSGATLTGTDVAVARTQVTAFHRLKPFSCCTAAQAGHILDFFVTPFAWLVIHCTVLPGMGKGQPARQSIVGSAPLG
jgi:hypothetical protein